MTKSRDYLRSATLREHRPGEFADYCTALEAGEGEPGTLRGR